jgi:uncharacterized protein (UPF0264 family)
MVRLLVSVRNAAEAESALVGGADVIDVKEPRRGALGPAEPTEWRAIQAVVRERAATSVALGELLSDGAAARAGEAAGFCFAKIGLAGCANEPRWCDVWREMTAALPAHVAAVPVAYADWQAAVAPRPIEVLELAATCPARLLLIDTHDKRAGNLLHAMPLDALDSIARAGRHMGVELALAGSLDAAGLAVVLPLQPAYVGVRGAACRGGRDGMVEAARVKSLARLIREAAARVGS